MKQSRNKKQHDVPSPWRAQVKRMFAKETNTAPSRWLDLTGTPTRPSFSLCEGCGLFVLFFFSLFFILKH